MIYDLGHKMMNTWIRCLENCVYIAILQMTKSSVFASDHV